MSLVLFWQTRLILPGKEGDGPVRGWQSLFSSSHCLPEPSPPGIGYSQTARICFNFFYWSSWDPFLFIPFLEYILQYYHRHTKLRLSNHNTSSSGGPHYFIITCVQWWYFKMSLFHRTIILGSKLSSNLFLLVLLYCDVWHLWFCNNYFITV